MTIIGAPRQPNGDASPRRSASADASAAAPAGRPHREVVLVSLRDEREMAVKLPICAKHAGRLQRIG